MASFDYGASAATALRLLARFGQELTLTRTTPGTYNPATGGTTDDVTTTQTVTAAVLPAGSGMSFDDSLKDMLVKGKLRQVLISALTPAGASLTFAPAPLDLLTLEGADWEVEGVTPLNPSGTPVMYTALVKVGGA